MLPLTAYRPAGAQAAEPGDSPYGPLATEPDEHGLLLPEGFTARVIATAGDLVADSEYLWPAFPDGAACFEAEEGGWIYVCNSEVTAAHTTALGGGVSAVRFAEDGTIVDAYQILQGSTSNCAGGPTPWGTWLSCEEPLDGLGQLWECDPTGEDPPIPQVAMGRWRREAAAVDPEGKAVYMTEDEPDGCLYRFTPATYPDLSAGLLEVATVAEDGAVTWTQVPDPTGTSRPTRQQVPEATPFNGGEGMWYHDGAIVFTTKGDDRVHRLDLAEQRHTVLWDGDPEGLGVEGAVLSGVDNITVDAGSGDLFVAEDGGNLEVVIISAEGTVAPFLRLVADGHEESELTGPCFSPDRSRLYVSSQRGPSARSLQEIIPGSSLDTFDGGITYEITGPFRAIAPPEAPERAEEPSGGGDGDGSALPLVVGGAVATAAIVGGAVALRRRRRPAPAPGELDEEAGEGGAPPAE